MKLAFVANTSWSIYKFRLDVARYLQGQGANIYIIAPRDQHSEKLIAEGFHFINAPIKAYSNNPLSDVRYLLFLLKTYRRHQFDHVFHYTIKSNIYGSLAAKVLGVPNTAVVTGMGRLLNIEQSTFKKITETLYKVGCSCAKAVWFLNEEDKRYFENENLVQSGKSFLLPSEGVNLDQYYPRKLEKKNHLNFLFAGRLIREKGILEYLNAAEAVLNYHPSTKFDIIGFLDPEDSDCIDAKVLNDFQQRGIIRFYGDREDVIPFISRAECVVLPSYYGEGISRILLEAAAMEKPIITSNNRGCKDVVIDGFNGFLCKPKDTNSLFDQMMCMISLDDNARIKMGKNGRNYVKQKYNVQNICKTYLDHIIEKNRTEKAVNQPVVWGKGQDDPK